MLRVPLNIDKYFNKKQYRSKTAFLEGAYRVLLERSMHKMLFGISGLLLILAFSICSIQCTGSSPPVAMNAERFKTITGLDLSSGAVIINSKTISVAFPALDSHYVIIKLHPGFKSVLEKNCESSSWNLLEEDLTPPDDWKADLSFWDATKLKGKLYFQKTLKFGATIDDGGYKVVMAFDEDSGVLHCASLQFSG